MASNRRQPLRHVKRVLLLLTATGSVVGIVLVYRWAEPSRRAINMIGAGASQPAVMTLQNPQYTSWANGYRNWSVRAGRLETDSPPGSFSAVDLQHAVITDIQEGALYSQPKQAPSPRRASMDDAPVAPPLATFSAGQGRYDAGAGDALPTDLHLIYSVLWQFRLSDGVRLTTRQGERLTAPSLTVLELRKWRTNHLERRIICDEGADVTDGKVTVHANTLRFDPASRVIECLNGVRGTLPAGKSVDTVQMDSAYWSLADRTVRCPADVTGVWNGIPFTTRELTIDTRNRNIWGASLSLQLRAASDLKLPQLRP